LAQYTRFGIGGPATLLVESADAAGFSEALGLVRESGLPNVVIGGGTNLIVSDAGFDGIVLRFTAERIATTGLRMTVDAGASLQAVVDRSVEAGLAGMETMTGIPGTLGAAVYGNAGAYGHSINERVEAVYVTDGRHARALNNAECRFEYRGSYMKSHKELVILAAELSFTPGDAGELAGRANKIRAIRDAKYPPTMKCAGSIFKNVFFANLPEPVQREIPTDVVREGKVPSAWFLEQVGAKGMVRGDIKVATYHANLIYNDGQGSAADVIHIIQELKRRVRERFQFDVEEEVQYVGF
jgi:UDP-N-acetylmuramate dehydrogenase